MTVPQDRAHVPEAEAIAANRRRWDARAAIHVRDATGFYGVEAFLAGERDRDDPELRDLGPVDGLRIAHLQCHFGMDTLRFLRLGAAEVAGLDFSPVAVAEARRLAARAGLTARFEEADVRDAPAVLGAGRWDLVYVTWGALCWLPDIDAWARAVAALLAPGGRLFLRDTHPTAALMDLEGGRAVPAYDWRTPRDRPLRFADPQTYTGDADPLPLVADCEWNHPVSAIVGGLLAAGLRLDALEEGETLPWDHLPGLTVEGPAGLWRLPDGHPKFPLSLTVRASRP